MTPATSTFFVLLQGIKEAATNRSAKAFHFAISRDTFQKAAVITLLALAVVVTGTGILAALEPQLSLMDVLFEVTSAFGTVGLSTGITPGLSVAGKLVIILVMYTGRIGAVTLISMWIEHPEPSARYSEETISIG